MIRGWPVMPCVERNAMKIRTIMIIFTSNAMFAVILNAYLICMSLK